MKLKFLAISDAHLGEDTSLLSFPQGRQRLWESLRQAFGSGERFDIDEVILVGDFPDRCLSSTVQIIAHTTDFMRMLGSAANIAKGVYIPGNHDHTLWTHYIRRKHNRETAVTPPWGDLLVEKGALATDHAVAEEILTIFFGYQKGSLWKEIVRQKQFDFVIANPLYATSFHDRTYVFAHGTHFRPDVTQPKFLKVLADWSQIDRFAGIEIDSNCDVTQAVDLENLEAVVTGLVDTLWPSSHDNPNPRSDRLWYILNLISGKFCLERPSPPVDQLFTFANLQEKPQQQVKKLVSTNNRLLDDSLRRWDEFFYGHMMTFLDAYNLLAPQLTFVYGDTHRGGWGQLHRNGRDIRIYNTGGWGTTQKENHPACHVFAVDDAGTEYILDVSMSDVAILGTPLLEEAAKDAEDRHSALGRAIRFFIDRMLPDCD